MTQIFQAGTQYNDFTGTVAADRSDSLSFADYLNEKGLLREGEHVVGFEIVFNENGGNAVPEPGIVAYLGQGAGVDEVSQNWKAGGVLNLRLVEVFDLPLAEFFRYFKRFDVMFSNKSLKMNGAEFQQID